jgi:hypothetical protein
VKKAVSGERGLSDESAMEEGAKEEDRAGSRLLMLVSHGY